MRPAECKRQAELFQKIRSQGFVKICRLFHVFQFGRLFGSSQMGHGQGKTVPAQKEKISLSLGSGSRLQTEKSP
jgi:hypothetical protein